MNRIHVLDAQTANLIAAGEVVDRPAAIVKELLENAIDARATEISLEIKNGGSTFLCVTDNGHGMSADDVRLSIQRHATSKIRDPEDLNRISTLGFRGEALAAIAAVSRLQMISRTQDADFGTLMNVQGGEILAFEETGCPVGTKMTVRDLFFNTPARRKFLKKDTTETAYISQYAEKIAISHPDIAFRYTADSHLKFATGGNGELADAMYSVYGGEVVEGLLPIERESDGMRVYGYITEPRACRPNRNLQSFFINGRTVKAKTMMFALEDAYKSYIMTDKYPGGAIFLQLNTALVDVNVHPAKLEVKFSDERKVFELIYFAVRDVLEKMKNPIAQGNVAQREKPEARPIDAKVFSYEKERDYFPFQKAISISKNPGELPLFDRERPVLKSASGNLIGVVRDVSSPPEKEIPRWEDTAAASEQPAAPDTKAEQPAILDREKIQPAIPDAKAQQAAVPDTEAEKPIYRGTIFHTYILAEANDCFYLIDKHAAHERILYESLKAGSRKYGSQLLMEPLLVSVSGNEYSAAEENRERLSEAGFDLEPFGDRVIAIRGIPAELTSLGLEDVREVFIEMLSNLSLSKNLYSRTNDAFDKILYMAACKAAVKAGIRDREEDYRFLLDKLFEYDTISYCPHGRPVMVRYTKYQIEKMFKRT